MKPISSLRSLFFLLSLIPALCQGSEECSEEGYCQAPPDEEIAMELHQAPYKPHRCCPKRGFEEDRSTLWNDSASWPTENRDSFVESLSR